jgi:pyruvate, water dikinase
MKLWQHLTSMIKKEPSKEKQDGEARERFLKRYRSFQELLSHNNSVLEMMADMEEKLSGDFIFDRRYVESKSAAVIEGVRKIIENLNVISRDKYSVLQERIDVILSHIEAVLARRMEIPESDYTIAFEHITKEKTDTVGGKSANLGEIRNVAGLPTPEGFAVTAFAYKRFMDHNGILGKIEELVSGIPLDNLEELNRMSRKIQDMILQAEIPHDLAMAITDAYSSLRERAGTQVLVSVRSSALREDGEFSFAGQHATFLEVPAEDILQRYKEVVASLFSSRAIFYYRTKGFRENDMVMSVGVLEMVDAKAGGVMYSRDPNDPESNVLLVNAVKGLGKSVVDGTVTPETYVIARTPDLTLLGKRIPVTGEVSEDVTGKISSGVSTHDRGPQSPSLREDELKILARFALVLEDHYGSPQDIEWAFDSSGRPFVLQTRPLRVLKQAKRSIPTRIPGYHILIERGVIASKGIGFGKVFFVRDDEDLQNFPDGAVLVAKHTSTKFVTVMNRASAIITDVGGAAGHMASLAREYRVPAILDTEIATTTLRDGQEVTVDALNCNIYEGSVQELIELSEQREEPFKTTELFKTLEGVLKWIVPLHLVDPNSENFKPESCESLHDITRFAHEKVMHEMFKTTRKSPLDEVESAVLKGRIPLEVYLIDLGGGIEGDQKKLKPEDIRSVPFNALYKGLLSMRWPEPRPVDAKGFLGMVAQSASIPEEDLHKIGEKSFAFVSGEYMNISIRLGYHLSTVEAYVGDTLNDNYIKFFFEGGGAVRDRKLRRVRLITEIIKTMDFNVKVTEDVIDASLTKYRKSTLEEKLEILGKLTVFTKQLDMVMYNDAITDFYIDDFVKTHVIKRE